MSLRVGLIGYGYWGPNLLRNLAATPGCEITMLADRDETRLGPATQAYPRVRSTTSPAGLIDDPQVDAVVIATPVSTHYELASAALDAGKHVLIEKPLASTVAEAQDLVERAEANRLALMVDHTFLYSGAVEKVRQLLTSGEVGDLLSYDSVRINLGLFQSDVNVLWDLGPHDISIMLYLLGHMPRAISAVGAGPVAMGDWRPESVVYVGMRFADGTLAHLHLDWLSPVKIRRTVISGSRRMVVYDHLDSDYQVKVFDKGLEAGQSVLMEYRTGDMVAPKVSQREPLAVVCEAFVLAAAGGQVPVSDGRFGTKVVQVLEAAQQSLDQDGHWVPI